MLKEVSLLTCPACEVKSSRGRCRAQGQLQCRTFLGKRWQRHICMRQLGHQGGGTMLLQQRSIYRASSTWQTRIKKIDIAISRLQWRGTKQPEDPSTAIELHVHHICDISKRPSSLPQSSWTGTQAPIVRCGKKWPACCPCAKDWIDEYQVAYVLSSTAGNRTYDAFFSSTDKSVENNDVGEAFKQSSSQNLG